MNSKQLFLLMGLGISFAVHAMDRSPEHSPKLVSTFNWKQNKEMAKQGDAGAMKLRAEEYLKEIANFSSKKNKLSHLKCAIKWFTRYALLSNSFDDSLPGVIQQIFAHAQNVSAKYTEHVLKERINGIKSTESNWLKDNVKQLVTTSQ